MKFKIILLLALLCRAIAADTAETIELGKKLTLTATADGNPAPSFEWFKNGVKVATGASFVVPALSANDAGDYTVKASNTEGDATSGKYVLTVDDRTVPVIASSPVDTQVKEGETLLLAAAATGKPAPAFQWQKNGVDVPGATNDRLFFAKVARTDSGSYVVVASNEKGFAKSPPALVDVLYAPTAPVITTAFSNVSVQKKTTVVLRVAALGDGLSYKWKKGTTNILGKVGPELVIPNANPADEGTYTVTVSNPFGSVSASAKLSILR